MKDIDIIYEDTHIIAINKPAGLVVHADGKTDEASVADWIMENRPDIKSVGEPWTTPDGQTIWRPGIVHRLDRETSGALVICKDQETYLEMKAKFQERDIEKTYHAFVYGEMKEDGGVIDRPIARSRNDFRQWSAQRGARGEAREAVTEYTVLRPTQNFTYVEVRPKTGRTHQIRVHFKAVNHPVVCDRLYAPKRDPALSFDRLALHASSIAFDLNGKSVSIEAPLPLDFQRALVLLG